MKKHEVPRDRMGIGDARSLGRNPMLTHIVRPSPALDTFLRPLVGSLSLPQRQHLLEMVDALLVTEDRKTLAALQRQFLDTTDVANWADFLRISPWSADLLRDAPLPVGRDCCATWRGGRGC